MDNGYLRRTSSDKERSKPVTTGMRSSLSASRFCSYEILRVPEPPEFTVSLESHEFLETNISEINY